MNPSLDQLRDIHLPEPVSWWPPAPGWWLLLAGTVLLASVLVWQVRRYANNRWRRQALQELAKLRALAGQESALQQCIAGLSVLLRRVAISRFPRRDVAALHGDAWLAFLDQSFGGAPAFVSDAGRALAAGPYARRAGIETDILHTLFSLSERWLKKLPARKRQ